jgi:hypothetical protein
MQKKFEAPELTVIGPSEEVVMGAGFGGGDILVHAASDFEFEQD